MSWTKTETNEAIERLREVIKPGDTVYTILQNVSSSGMSRRIRVVIMQDNAPRDITRLVSKAIRERYNDRHEALVVGGCGMDMGFHVVYELSHYLYPNGFECTGQDRDKAVYCPSNDHSNGDRDYTPHMHTSGGYALKHRWM